MYGHAVLVVVGLRMWVATSFGISMALKTAFDYMELSSNMLC